MLVAVTGFAEKANSAATNVNTYWNCPEAGGEISFRLSGHLFLHSKSLIAAESNLGKAALTDAITQQLRFAQGHFVHQKMSDGRIVMKMSTDPVIEDIQSRAVAYPYSLTIDPVEHPDVKTTHPYLLAALKAKNIKKGEPGQKVSYTARITALYCGPKPKPTELKIELPSEPYLAYWLVKPQDRKQIRWHYSTFKVNPCSDTEYADIPDPYFYWYFWKPRAIGTDASGKSYSCENLMREGREFASFTAQDLQVNPIPTHFSLNQKSLKNLKISALFGVVDPKSIIFDYAQALKELSKIKSPTLGDLKKAFVLLPKGKSVDPGSENLVVFVQRLQTLLNQDRATVAVDQEKQIVTIHSELLRSGKKTQIDLFFGQTDVLTTADATYWNALADALKYSDVILYSGHSGLGENMKLSYVAAAAKQKESELFTEAPDHQILGLFSCYSYSYFGDEIARLRSEKSKVTDIIRTATAFTSAQGHIALIKALDGSFDRKPAEKSDEPWFGARALIVMTRLGELK